MSGSANNSNTDLGLIAHIRKFVALSEKEAAVLMLSIKTRLVKKKELLLKEGQVCKANYFVQKGCLHMFFTDDKGAEQTSQFAIENWWMTDYGSFGSGLASQFNIQAASNSTIMVFEKAAQEKLYSQLPQLERYFRRVLEKSYGASQWRIKYIFSLSKEERYKHFMAAYPEFAQRVPQYMLASFLGLTPEYVSEIRRKKS